MEIKEWLINWFCNHSSLDAAQLETTSNEDYLKKGVIDSFSFVMLISDIDDEFDIAFTNEDFLDPRFSSIDGLTEMIKERKE